MTESIFALIGTVFAGFGLKFFDWLVNRKTEQRIREEQARKELKEDKIGDLADRREQILELRTELQGLRDTVNATEAEMLQWREKYWTLREEQITTLANLTTALNKIKELTGNGNGTSKS